MTLILYGNICIHEDYNDEKQYIESRNKTAKPYYKLHIILVLTHTT